MHDFLGRDIFAFGLADLPNSAEKANPGHPGGAREARIRPSAYAAELAAAPLVTKPGPGKVVPGHSGDTLYMYANILRLGLLVAGLAVLTPAQLQAQSASPFPGSFTGNVAIVSDYIIRGVSLSNENPAVQGGLDWDSGMGVYAGIWGSSVEFGNDASAEIDFAAGFRGAIDNLHYELGATYYWYPETVVAGQSFWDAHADLGYDFGFSDLTLGIAYTTDDSSPLLNDKTIYYKARIVLPVAEMMTISAGAGRSQRERRTNYSDWNAGATFKVYDWFDLDARYFDSDDVVCGTLCDARFVVKISRSF